MNMKPENACPVCGYGMQAPPRDYRICPSCGTEFGVSDINATIAELRDSWMSRGPVWWGDPTDKPSNWDPISQMESAGIIVKRPAANETSAVGTATSSRTIRGQSWGAWGASASASPGDRSRVVVCD